MERYDISLPPAYLATSTAERETKGSSEPGRVEKKLTFVPTRNVLATPLNPKLHIGHLVLDSGAGRALVHKNSVRFKWDQMWHTNTPPLLVSPEASTPLAFRVRGKLDVIPYANALTGTDKDKLAVQNVGFSEEMFLEMAHLAFNHEIAPVYVPATNSKRTWTTDIPIKADPAILERRLRMTALLAIWHATWRSRLKRTIDLNTALEATAWVEREGSWSKTVLAKLGTKNASFEMKTVKTSEKRILDAMLAPVIVKTDAGHWLVPWWFAITDRFNEMIEHSSKKKDNPEVGFIVEGIYSHLAHMDTNAPVVRAAAALAHLVVPDLTVLTETLLSGAVVPGLKMLMKLDEDEQDVEGHVKEFAETWIRAMTELISQTLAQTPLTNMDDVYFDLSVAARAIEKLLDAPRPKGAVDLAGDFLVLHDAIAIGYKFPVLNVPGHRVSVGRKQWDKVHAYVRKNRAEEGDNPDAWPYYQRARGEISSIAHALKGGPEKAESTQQSTESKTPDITSVNADPGNTKPIKNLLSVAKTTTSDDVRLKAYVKIRYQAACDENDRNAYKDRVHKWIMEVKEKDTKWTRRKSTNRENVILETKDGGKTAGEIRRKLEKDIGHISAYPAAANDYGKIGDTGTAVYLLEKAMDLFKEIDGYIQKGVSENSSTKEQAEIQVGRINRAWRDLVSQREDWIKREASGAAQADGTEDTTPSVVQADDSENTATGVTQVPGIDSENTATGVVQADDMKDTTTGDAQAQKPNPEDTTPSVTQVPGPQADGDVGEETPQKAHDYSLAINPGVYWKKRESIFKQAIASIEKKLEQNPNDEDLQVSKQHVKDDMAWHRNLAELRKRVASIAEKPGEKEKTIPILREKLEALGKPSAPWTPWTGNGTVISDDDVIARARKIVEDASVVPDNQAAEHDLSALDKKIKGLETAINQLVDMIEKTKSKKRRKDLNQQKSSMQEDLDETREKRARLVETSLPNAPPDTTTVSAPETDSIEAAIEMFQDPEKRDTAREKILQELDSAKATLIEAAHTIGGWDTITDPDQLDDDTLGEMYDVSDLKPHVERVDHLDALLQAMNAIPNNENDLLGVLDKKLDGALEDVNRIDEFLEEVNALRDTNFGEAHDRFEGSNYSELYSLDVDVKAYGELIPHPSDVEERLTSIVGKIGKTTEKWERTQELFKEEQIGTPESNDDGFRTPTENPETPPENEQGSDHTPYDKLLEAVKKHETAYAEMIAKQIFDDTENLPKLIAQPGGIENRVKAIRKHRVDDVIGKARGLQNATETTLLSLSRQVSDNTQTRNQLADLLRETNDADEKAKLQELLDTFNSTLKELSTTVANSVEGAPYKLQSGSGEGLIEAKVFVDNLLRATELLKKAGIEINKKHIKAARDALDARAEDIQAVEQAKKERNRLKLAVEKLGELEKVLPSFLRGEYEQFEADARVNSFVTSMVKPMDDISHTLLDFEEARDIWSRVFEVRNSLGQHVFEYLELARQSEEAKKHVEAIASAFGLDNQLNKDILRTRNSLASPETDEHRAKIMFRKWMVEAIRSENVRKVERTYYQWYLDGWIEKEQHNGRMYSTTVLSNNGKWGFELGMDKAGYIRVHPQSPTYAQGTEWSIADGDALIILNNTPVIGLTVKQLAKLGAFNADKAGMELIGADKTVRYTVDANPSEIVFASRTGDNKPPFVVKGVQADAQYGVLSGSVTQISAGDVLEFVENTRDIQTGDELRKLLQGTSVTLGMRTETQAERGQRTRPFLVSDEGEYSVELLRNSNKKWGFSLTWPNPDGTEQHPLLSNVDNPVYHGTSQRMRVGDVLIKAGEVDALKNNRDAITQYFKNNDTSLHLTLRRATPEINHCEEATEDDVREFRALAISVGGARPNDADVGDILQKLQKARDMLNKKQFSELLIFDSLFIGWKALEERTYPSQEDAWKQLPGLDNPINEGIYDLRRSIDFLKRNNRPTQESEKRLKKSLARVFLGHDEVSYADRQYHLWRARRTLLNEVEAKRVYKTTLQKQEGGRWGISLGENPEGDVHISAYHAPDVVYADQNEQELAHRDILVAVNNSVVEGMSLEEVQSVVKNHEKDTLRLHLRSPGKQERTARWARQAQLTQQQHPVTVQQTQERAVPEKHENRIEDTRARFDEQSKKGVFVDRLLDEIGRATSKVEKLLAKRGLYDPAPNPAPAVEKLANARRMLAELPGKKLSDEQMKTVETELPGLFRSRLNVELNNSHIAEGVPKEHRMTFCRTQLKIALGWNVDLNAQIHDKRLEIRGARIHRDSTPMEAPSFEQELEMHDELFRLLERASSEGEKLSYADRRYHEWYVPRAQKSREETLKNQRRWLQLQAAYNVRSPPHEKTPTPRTQTDEAHHEKERKGTSQEATDALSSRDDIAPDDKQRMRDISEETIPKTDQDANRTEENPRHSIDDFEREMQEDEDDRRARNQHKKEHREKKELELVQKAIDALSSWNHVPFDEWNRAKNIFTWAYHYPITTGVLEKHSERESFRRDKTQAGAFKLWNLVKDGKSEYDQTDRENLQAEVARIREEALGELKGYQQNKMAEKALKRPDVRFKPDEETLGREIRILSNLIGEVREKGTDGLLDPLPEEHGAVLKKARETLAELERVYELPDAPDITRKTVERIRKNNGFGSPGTGDGGYDLKGVYNNEDYPLDLRILAADAHLAVLEKQSGHLDTLDKIEIWRPVEEKKKSLEAMQEKENQQQAGTTTAHQPVAHQQPAPGVISSWGQEKITSWETAPATHQRTPWATAPPLVASPTPWATAPPLVAHQHTPRATAPPPATHQHTPGHFEFFSPTSQEEARGEKHANITITRNGYGGWGIDFEKVGGDFVVSSLGNLEYISPPTRRAVLGDVLMALNDQAIHSTHTIRDVYDIMKNTTHNLRMRLAPGEGDNWSDAETDTVADAFYGPDNPGRPKRKQGHGGAPGEFHPLVPKLNDDGRFVYPPMAAREGGYIVATPLLTRFPVYRRSDDPIALAALTPKQLKTYQKGMAVAERAVREEWEALRSGLPVKSGGTPQRRGAVISQTLEDRVVAVTAKAAAAANAIAASQAFKSKVAAVTAKAASRTFGDRMAAVVADTTTIGTNTAPPPIARTGLEREDQDRRHSITDRQDPFPTVHEKRGEEENAWAAVGVSPDDAEGTGDKTGPSVIPLSRPVLIVDWVLWDDNTYDMTQWPPKPIKSNLLDDSLHWLIDPMLHDALSMAKDKKYSPFPFPRPEGWDDVILRLVDLGFQHTTHPREEDVSLIDHIRVYPAVNGEHRGPAYHVTNAGVSLFITWAAASKHRDLTDFIRKMRVDCIPGTWGNFDDVNWDRPLKYDTSPRHKIAPNRLSVSLYTKYNLGTLDNTRRATTEEEFRLFPLIKPAIDVRHWRGLYDMTVWPPKKLSGEPLDTNLLHWLVDPLILDAYHGRRAFFPFPRPEGWYEAVKDLHDLFEGGNPSFRDFYKKYVRDGTDVPDVQTHTVAREGVVTLLEASITTGEYLGQQHISDFLMEQADAHGGDQDPLHMHSDDLDFFKTPAEPFGPVLPARLDGTEEVS